MQSRPSRTLEQILEQSRSDVQRYGERCLSVDHIFLAILRENHSHATYILRKMLKEWEIHQIRTRIERELSRPALKACDQADEQKFYDTLRTQLSLLTEGDVGVPGRTINTGHLLLAVVRDRKLVSARVLESYNVTEKHVLE